MQNNEKLAQLLSNFKLDNSYEEVRGNPKELPFEDFWNLSKMEKKVVLDRLGETKPELASLHDGIIKTQRHCIPFGYFVFSALLCLEHIILAQKARINKCEPDRNAHIAAGVDTSALDGIILAKELAARICYEGEGALGGTSPRMWSFYGKLFGVGHEPVISDVEAASYRTEYVFADKATKAQLFWEWWNEVHYNLRQTRNTVDWLHYGFRMVSRYKQLENPMNMTPFNEKDLFDWYAVIAGFSRRAAKGVGEGNAYAADDQSVERLYTYLWDYNLNKVQTTVTSMFEMSDGTLSGFGAKLVRNVPLYVEREKTVNLIVSRREENEDDGLPTEVAKKGVLK
jgi:hypothetical protein